MKKSKNTINNAFYDTLGEEWYAEQNHPIVLLRAENAVRMPWILERIQTECGGHAKVLDVGCGGGLLSNPLAEAGLQVTGIDLSQPSLEMAKKRDATKTVRYVQASAYELPFADASFDAVCALDLLEHVEDPQKVIREASRVLKEGGLFFFHTFNRNIWSYLLVIKGVEWAVPSTPERMHVYPLFIKPAELKRFCNDAQIVVEEMRGLTPKMTVRGVAKMLFRKIPRDFRFIFSSSLRTGYLGYGRKISFHRA